MSWRTVIISNQAKLDCKMGYLVVRGLETKRVLIDEIGTLLIENSAVSITGCLIEVLIEKKVKVIFCDSKRNPAAELVPHHGSHDSAAKIRTQVCWSEDIKAAVWREIVAEKIRHQAKLLHECSKEKEAGLLESYLSQIEPMDASNREGHAAKVYFNALFGMDFTRSADIPINAALNYGYSILLSSFNREIAANGYLTQLGIYHNNMFNHYNLGSDLMESYRILVDRDVYNLLPHKFEKYEKHRSWEVLDQTIIIDGTKQSVRNAIKIYVRSIFAALNDNDISLIKPYNIEAVLD